MILSDALILPILQLQT